MLCKKPKLIELVAMFLWFCVCVMMHGMQYQRFSEFVFYFHE